MTRTEQMRRAISERPGRTPAPPTPAPAAPPPPPAAPAPSPAAKVEAPPAEIITFRCGHKIGVGHFRCEDCGHCRAVKRRERNRQQPTAPRVFRLPDGTVKTLTFAAGRWHGTMNAPGAPTFTAEAYSEREVCHGLHALYADWLAANQEGEGAR